jgi:hypothetical protein
VPPASTSPTGGLDTRRSPSCQPRPQEIPTGPVLATRCRSLRHELDPLDDQLDLLDPDARRAKAVTHAVLIRDQLDRLDALIETWVAGR